MNKLLYAFCVFSLLLVGCKDDEEKSLPNNNQNVGSSAADFLKAETFSKVVMEIQYPSGYALPAGSISGLESFLLNYCNKPDGIEIITTEIPVAAAQTYSLDDVRGIESQYRTKFNTEGTLAFYIFVADGDYETNTQNSFTLGLAYKNTSIVVFGETIKSNSGGLGEPSEERVTTALLEHELGHLLGLVNVGSPMVDDHEDDDHNGHCAVESCLMYYTLNSVSAMGNLMGNLPTLDAQCEADLRANGGK
jgi:hypothetical protein